MWYVYTFIRYFCIYTGERGSRKSNFWLLSMLYKEGGEGQKACKYAYVIYEWSLSEASILGDLTEVPVPTRFIFILLGPAVSQF